MKRIKTHRQTKKVFKLGQEVWLMRHNAPKQFYVSEIADKLTAANTDFPTITTRYVITDTSSDADSITYIRADQLAKTKEALIENFVAKHAK